MSVALSLNAHVLPNTPSSGADSGSPSIPPPTPLSPTGSGSSFPDSGAHDTSRPNTANTHTNNNNNTNDAPTGNVKRKASRRANTAERRATHNAVERQRRETLNGRFLDLAALLPNLATVRRPSKSAIVNSSIALIHSQRRARAAAGRELRALEAEADALRREVNEWRARSGAGLPALQAPARTQEFASLVNAEDLGAQAEEEERRAYALAGQEQDGEGEDYEDGAPEEPAYHAHAHAPAYVRGAGTGAGVDMAALNEVAHARAVQALAQGHPRGLPVPAPNVEAEKLAQWNAQLQYALAQQQRHAQERQAQEWAHHAHAQAALFTPPGTGHGAPNPNAPAFETPDAFAGFARQSFATPFAYGLPALPGLNFPGPHGTPPSTGDLDESGTESTHGSPGSSGHSEGFGAQIGGQVGYAHAPRRPSLSMAHSTGHVPQQQQQWTAAATGGGGQFAAMGMLI